MTARRLAAVALTSAAFAAIAAGPASAGEVNGNGEELPLMGHSICKYSGLNDEWTDQEPTLTQSYGTFLVLIKSTTGLSAREVMTGILPSPGDACNPTRGFEE